MNELFSTGGPLRKEAYRRLKVFLVNPGKFCLIVLGSRGTGKHFAIETAFNEIKIGAHKDLCLEKLEFISAVNIPFLQVDLDLLLKKHQYQTIVIEDVERLTHEQQDLLFAALSTFNGKFGIEKKYDVRIVFTSSTEIEFLREDENLLKGLFWDRISQLVVEIPSYKVESECIVQDFYSTWGKMKFQNTKGFGHFGKAPKNATMEKFLEDDAAKFDGGFRDLDKLACMYFNYRILFYGKDGKIREDMEKKIVASIKEDFIGKSQLHSNTGNDSSIFQINRGYSMADLNGQFKIQVRKWAKKVYGTIAKAEQELGLGQGTMKNWTEKKVTIAQREKFRKST